MQQQQKKKKKPPKPLIFSEVDNVQCVICAHVIYFFFVSPKFRLLLFQNSSENMKQSFFSPLSLMKQVEAVARASYCQAQR